MPLVLCLQIMCVHLRFHRPGQLNMEFSHFLLYMVWFLLPLICLSYQKRMNIYYIEKGTEGVLFLEQNDWCPIVDYFHFITLKKFQIVNHKIIEILQKNLVGVKFYSRNKGFIWIVKFILLSTWFSNFLGICRKHYN